MTEEISLEFSKGQMIIILLIILGAILSVGIVMYLNTSYTSVDVFQARMERMEKWLYLPRIGGEINGGFWGVTENMTIVEARAQYQMWGTYPQAQNLMRNVMTDICDG